MMMATYPTNAELQKMGEWERKAIWRKMPKMELHLHGDIACPIYSDYASGDTAFTEQDILQNIVCNYKIKDLVEFIDKTRMICKIFSNNQKILERCTTEAILAKHREGVVGLEFRFSPAYLAEGCGYSFDEVLDSVFDGIEQAKQQITTPFEVGAIYIGEVGIDDKFSFEDSVDYFLKNREKFIGFDNAGYPAPFSPHAAQFKRLVDAGVNLTLHAGETPPDCNDRLATALDLGAQRIGHGIECVKSPEMMKRLIDQDVILEVCPKSNWITNPAINMNDHPIRRIYDAGVKICINTDDPMMMTNSLHEEYDMLFTHLGFGYEDFVKMNTWALEKSFLSREAKIKLKETYFPGAKI
ncbi:adenosine deaminase, putative [Babesia bigemina]|uniref:adenosine deaminase n=1 Tax=Babesia bigemina TaxID=5866 RepID=A0A061D3U7_BABBI|nr:adenosine deaminase, putative [Babesia bigemina]CDR95386.1 adenosine deaminase, putative [Babesia bigemina]|eukprot:XP_012767572.1 adenosine deaminase, putative [Babesia bigemina]